MAQYKWEFLGAGSYNNVFADKDKKRVLKLQIIIEKGDKDAEFDTPIRAVRLWNEINPNSLPLYLRGML